MTNAAQRGTLSDFIVFILTFRSGDFYPSGTTTSRDMLAVLFFPSLATSEAVPGHRQEKSKRETTGTHFLAHPAEDA